jgi:dTDP-4-dehydrorhamnose 3,5-epimerase
MIIKKLDFDGVMEIQPTIHHDNRGDFVEAFNPTKLLVAAGIDFKSAQTNLSTSKAGTIRGIHFADVPPGQAKYVQCVAGKAWDVIVDLRPHSETFGLWIAVTLDSELHNAVHIPEGFGHAFQALMDDTKVLYQCSTAFNPEAEHEVNPFDETLDIKWPLAASLVSEKDRNAPSFKTFFRVAE